MPNIEFNALLNDAGFMATMRSMASQVDRLQSEIDKISNRRLQLKYDTIDARQQILNLKNEIAELKDMRLSFKADSSEYKKLTSDIKAKYREIQNIMRGKEQLNIDTSKANANIEETRMELQQVKSAMQDVENHARSVESAFAKIGGIFSGAGRILQSGSDIFGGKIVGTVKTMATAFGTMGLYSAAQGTVSRYDTMRMFPKMMEHLGYSAADAEKAVSKLEEAVLGLPTGLDEIVASARQLIPLTGSLKKGTNLAIAANNAFLAGGADSQSVNYGQRQIKDLLSKGELRSQEWDSLFTALGSGLGVIAEEMGYSSKASKGASNVNDQLAYAESRLKSLRNTQKRLAMEGGTAKAIQKNADAIKIWEKEYDNLSKKQDKSLGTFRNALKTNQIDALDFLDALEKVGTGEGELAKRADDYKDTLTATAQNIKNAIQKLGAAGLDSLDTFLLPLRSRSALPL